MTARGRACHSRHVPDPPGPLTPLLSSGPSYEGAVATFFSLAPGALDLERSDHYNLAVHVGRPHRLWERRDGVVRYGAHKRGDVVVVAAGERRVSSWDRASSFVGIQLTAKLVDAVAEGQGINPVRIDIVGAFSARDLRLEQLAFVLLHELLAGLPSGRVYGETVAACIAARLIEGYSHDSRRTRPRARGGLSPATVGRALDFIHGSLAGAIALSDLARLADLSPFHFAREFRVATGVPPHAYVLRARVEEATRLILSGRVTCAEAAALVGFSSQGHLTRHMRRLLGVTPGHLRASTRLRSLPLSAAGLQLRRRPHRLHDEHVGQTLQEKYGRRPRIVELGKDERDRRSYERIGCRGISGEHDDVGRLPEEWRGSACELEERGHDRRRCATTADPSRSRRWAHPGAVAHRRRHTRT